jgi:thioredoxin 1
MLTVTAKAKDKLKEVLQQQGDSQMAIRIISSPSKPGQLQLGLDTPKEEDQVVEAEDGKKLLLIGPDLVPTLDRIVMDYQETSQGSGFTMSEIPQEAEISKAPERKAGKIVQITDQTFEEEVLKSDLPTEVDFWAPWCGPCQMVIPIYEKLSEEYEGRFKFCMINVDENQRTAMQYQIMSIPMQKYFANGEVVDEILGAVPEQTIRAKVEEILKRFPADEVGRLKLLLTSWVEHNKKHGEQFRQWAEKVKDMKSDPIYSRALQAAQQLEKANEQLSQALTQLPSATGIPQTGIGTTGTMANNISLEDVQREVGQVMHPAINRSLVDLGMVKDVALKDDVVTLTLVLPALDIPASVKDHLVDSLRTAVAKLGPEVEVEITKMNEEERYNFLAMEQESWKGLA